MRRNDSNYAGVDERYRPASDSPYGDDSYNNDTAGRYNMDTPGGYGTNRRQSKKGGRFVGIIITVAILFLVVPILIQFGMIAGFFGLANNMFDRADRYSSSMRNDTQEKMENMINESDVKTHNFKFTFAAGTHNGSNVKRTIDDVIDSNKKAVLDSGNGILITVVYHEWEISDPVELKSMKLKFEDWAEYEVSVEYNAQGYIVQIVIEDMNDLDGLDELPDDPVEQPEDAGIIKERWLFS